MMAILKAKKIKAMPAAEAAEKLRELRLELSKEKAASNVGGTVKNPGRVRELRRTIARLLSMKKEVVR